MEFLARLAVLEQKSRGNYIEMLGVLYTIMTNIIEHPSAPKYRQLKLKQPYLSEKVFKINGGIEFLESCGFEKDGEYIIYRSQEIPKLTQARDAIKRKLSLLCPGETVITSIGSITQSYVNSTAPEIQQSSSNGPTTPRVITSPNPFLQSIEDKFLHVLQYEDEKLLKKALACIPKASLELKAVERLRERQAAIKSGDCEGPEMSLPVALLIELLSWFKESFFQWVDKPSCRSCGNDTNYSHISTMNDTEIYRVEVYNCTACNTESYFPRYNDPGKLLVTRRGRCGEWANCFTLLCRALEYDARFVADTTDHVWTEVYCNESKRWLHCDPCENTIDTPLMYENGWGKKLEYVIAYSRDDIQDVTWRYSSHHKELLKRRRKCAESDLVKTIVRLREYRLNQITEARRNYVLKRSVQELVELMVEKKPKDNENGGRISGSINWRLQRGETKKLVPFIWHVKGNSSHNLSYYAALDEYRLTNSDETVLQTVKDWTKGAYEMNNIFRKEEKDWKMVYLSRTEQSTVGDITWMIESDSIIKTVIIQTLTKVYENGKVKWQYKQGGGQWLDIHCSVDGSPYTEKISLHSTCVLLRATLSGGRGSVSWQHAQLFRQSMSYSSPALSITVLTKDD